MNYPDIGLYHIATRRHFSRNLTFISGQRKEFYTVTDTSDDVHIYHNPFGQDDEAIEFIVEGIQRAFVDPDVDRELQVDGEYPDYYIEDVSS